MFFKNFLSTFALYLDRRLLWVFLLGCSSGFPWVLISSNMTGWLTDNQLSLTKIGLMGSILSIYATNFLWSPLVDTIKIPFLYDKLGQRRSWILLCQILILIINTLLAQFNPQQDLQQILFLALMIALVSATQDIAIDAFRIDTFSKSDKNNKLPQAAVMSTIGYVTGYSLPGYLSFSYADEYGWNTVYLGMNVIILCFIGFTLLVREPKTQREALQEEVKKYYERKTNGNRLSVWFNMVLIEPFVDFFRRNNTHVALSLLLFILLFKIGEAFLGRMSTPFYRDIGFSNEDVAQYSKLIGWGATVVFTLIGGFLNVRFGIIKGLFIGGIAMAASNLMFAWLAHDPREEILFWVIIIDNFTTAISIVTFVSFLTLLTGQAFSATQYALLASLGNISRTMLSSFSGVLVEMLDKNWTLFFILTTLMVIPSLVLLYSLRHYFKDILNQASNTKEEQLQENALVDKEKNT